MGIEKLDEPAFSTIFGAALDARCEGATALQVCKALIGVAAMIGQAHEFSTIMMKLDLDKAIADAEQRAEARGGGVV